MRKSYNKFISVILFIIIFGTLFLAQFESLTDGMSKDSFSVLSQYPNPDQSGGLFGGGFFTTFNGFGSINAILTVVITLFITIMILIETLSRKILITMFVFMVILYLLSFFEIVIAPFFLLDHDRLKIGFYLLRIMEMILFYLAFVNIKPLQKTKIVETDLIDD